MPSLAGQQLMLWNAFRPKSFNSPTNVCNWVKLLRMRLRPKTIDTQFTFTRAMSALTSSRTEALIKTQCHWLHISPFVSGSFELSLYICVFASSGTFSSTFAEHYRWMQCTQCSQEFHETLTVGHLTRNSFVNTWFKCVLNIQCCSTDARNGML